VPPYVLRRRTTGHRQVADLCTTSLDRTFMGEKERSPRSAVAEGRHG
jgi:hypothetical protein